MADTNAKIMAMVEKELQADPNISNDQLRQKAEKLDPSIAALSARQFNAIYPLQVKRRMRPQGAGGRKRSASKGGRKTGAKKAGRRAGGTAGRKAAGGAKAGRRGRSGTTAGDGTRGKVRAALLDFARDLASADGAGLVDVIAGVDDYVERVMKATGQN